MNIGNTKLSFLAKKKLDLYFSQIILKNLEQRGEIGGK